MIEKMKYLNITGRLEDIDRIINKYILEYEIHLEYALKELKDTTELEAVSLTNPYMFPLKVAENFAKMTKLPMTIRKDISIESACKILEIAEDFYTVISEKIVKLQDRKEHLTKMADNFEPFQLLDFDVDNITDFKYIKYHFGKMPVSSYKQFESFVYNKSEILFVKGKSDSEFVWGVYFTSSTNESMLESVFSSFHFKEIKMSFELDGERLHGSPSILYNNLLTMIETLDEEIKHLEATHISGSDISNEDIVASYNKIKDSYDSFNLRKYAAQTNYGYCIFIGWIPADQADSLEQEISTEKNILLITEDIHEDITSKPPTKLKNFGIFKPFEEFVKMYGLPSYNEVDPTAFVAITYILLFGIMFGDVGQGFTLIILGLFLSKVKGMNLGKVISTIGVSSMIFGFLYGSIFGFEHLIHAIWMEPMQNMNEILIVTVGLGVCLILCAMTINIYNMIKSKRINELLFDPNGIAGMIFYVSVVAVIVLTLVYEITLTRIATIILLPIAMFIGFRKPLISLINNKEAIIEGSIPMFLTETIIELFEALLCYLTNTISFVRVGAFALSHAGIMGVIMLLAENSSGLASVIIIIVGNILVIAMKGLIVGIQVLRLEFYEMFSRFFKGEGYSFESSKIG